MAGDIVVNIYADGGITTAGPCGGSRRKSKGFEGSDCISFEPDYPKCLEGCVIESKVKVNDSRVAQVYFSVVLEGPGFPLCFSLEEPHSSTAGDTWSQTFFCLFCAGNYYRVYAVAYDAMGNFLCEISGRTNRCPGFFFDEAGQKEILAFKKHGLQKQREVNQALMNEAKKLYEQLRNKARQSTT